jgi:hypothetical protein
MLGFLHLPKNKRNYSHMKATNIINRVCTGYKGTIVYEIKSTLGFGYNQINKGDRAMEMMLMTMMMEIDVEAFKILVSFSSLCGGGDGDLCGGGYGGGGAAGFRRGGYGVMRALPWLLTCLNRLKEASQ